MELEGTQVTPSLADKVLDNQELAEKHSLSCLLFFVVDYPHESLCEHSGPKEIAASDSLL